MLVLAACVHTLKYAPMGAALIVLRLCIACPCKGPHDALSSRGDAMRHRVFGAICAFAAASLLSVWSTTAAAAGFAINEQSVKGLGSAFASGAALAEDASTVFFNPAGLTRLRGIRAEAAAHIIVPSAKFTNQGSALNSAFTGGMRVPGTLSGGDGGDAGDVALVPNIYYAHELTDRLYAGLGVNAPFGLKTEYDDGWVGRYHALTSELQTINVNPSLAFKVNQYISIGAGLNIQYIDARLTSAIDQSVACLGLVAAGTVPSALCAGTGLMTPGNVATDANVDIDDATDISFGYNVGVLITLARSTRFGIHFRSKIRHKLEGAAEFSNVNTAFSDATGLFVNQDATATITLPETVSISAYQQLTAQWSVLLDITWTNWSRFDELVVNFEGGQPPLVQPQNWDDSFRYALGVQYTPSLHWTFRTGVAYDETPVPNAEDRNPRIPDEDRFWIAVGASYQFSDRLSFDVGYAHLFFKDPDINNTDVSTGHILTGEYDADANIFSAQLSYRFN